MLASKGNHPTTVDVMLQLAQHKLGPRALAEILNMKCGRNELGVYDMAIKCDKDLIECLTQHGARPQNAPPSDWERGRRRDDTSLQAHACRGDTGRTNVDMCPSIKHIPNLKSTGIGTIL